MEKRIGIFEAKTKLSELCGSVAESGVEYVITRRGKPIARIVAHDHENRNHPLTRISIGEAVEQWEAAHSPEHSKSGGDFPDVWRERRGGKQSPFEVAEKSARKRK
jgi:prevent-host-death family protein